MNRPGVLLCVLATVFGLAMVGSVVASDQPTIVYPEHEERTVAPGETVEVRVFVESDGGYGDIGIANLTLDASYETDLLSATDVETASYLERGTETDVYDETRIDDDAGTVVARQWRDPPRNGSTGIAQFATVTFEVAEDAPETNTTVSFVDTQARLVGDYEVFVYEHNATFNIDHDTAGTAATEQSGASAFTPSSESSADDDGPLAIVDGGPMVAVGLLGAIAVGGVAVFVGRRYGE